MIWTGLAALNQFVNSVVWNSDVTIRAPVWCDICGCLSVFFLLSGFSHHSRAATQFMTASSVAIPAASLCINRRLYHIASVQSVTTTRAQKRRDIIVDLAIGVGLPIVVTIIRECYGRDSSGIGADLPIDFCFQSNRFILMEEIGCYPFTFNTPLAYPFYFCVPLVIGLVSATYCCTCARNASQ